MSKRKCGLCGKDPAAGFASIGDTFYCHGDNDDDPTCYMRAQWPSGSDVLRELAKEANVDPMVPKGYVEIRDAGGTLLRRQWLGSSTSDPSE